MNAKEARELATDSDQLYDMLQKTIKEAAANKQLDCNYIVFDPNFLLLQKAIYRLESEGFSVCCGNYVSALQCSKEDCLDLLKDGLNHNTIGVSCVGISIYW